MSKTTGVKAAKAAKAANVESGNAPKLGEINIVGLFEAEAAALLQAADRGLILHKTHNTRDSGALLESTFRQIVGSRLPPQAQMAHGYLYDLESTCTSQIDAMLLSAADNYPMMAVEVRQFMHRLPAVGPTSRLRRQPARWRSSLVKSRIFPRALQRWLPRWARIVQGPQCPNEWVRFCCTRIPLA